MKLANFVRRAMQTMGVKRVVFPDKNDDSTWFCVFDPTATQQQKDEANNELHALEFDSDAATLREQVYVLQSDPLLLKILGYSIELERETDPAKRAVLTTKRNELVDAYVAAKNRIRDEYK